MTNNRDARNRSLGYQEALDDIAQALIDGGIHKALLWVKDNSHTEQTRTRAEAFAETYVMMRDRVSLDD